MMYGLLSSSEFCFGLQYPKLFLPYLWTLEIAQFAMVAYYILGGPFLLQIGANVRMDLFYGGWTDHKKALVDVFTIFIKSFIEIRNARMRFLKFCPSFDSS